MIKFLYDLGRAFRMVRQELRFIEVYDLPTSWTEDDSTKLRAFMSTETGQKLKQRLTNMVFRSAVSATQAGGQHAKFNLGVARGVAGTVASFQEHFIPRVRRGNIAPSGASQS